MDKEKIKTAVSGVKELIDELVAEGKLDGDLGKKMLSVFIQRLIDEELRKSQGVE